MPTVMHRRTILDSAKVGTISREDARAAVWAVKEAREAIAAEAAKRTGGVTAAKIEAESVAGIPRSGR